MVMSRVDEDWVVQMVNTTSFNESCKRHPPCRLRYFCSSCVEPICGFCDGHRDCEVIEIFKCSGAPSVRVNLVKKKIGISKICWFKVNKEDVVYLRNNLSSVASKIQDRCQICSRSLPYNAPYCSILCKINAIQGNAGVQYENHGEDNEMVREGQQNHQAFQHIPRHVAMKGTHRTRRKGIPVRSPFF